MKDLDNNNSMTIEHLKNELAEKYEIIEDLKR